MACLDKASGLDGRDGKTRSQRPNFGEERHRVIHHGPHPDADMRWDRRNQCAQYTAPVGLSDGGDTLSERKNRGVSLPFRPRRTESRVISMARQPSMHSSMPRAMAASALDARNMAKHPLVASAENVAESAASYHKREGETSVFKIRHGFFRFRTSRKQHAACTTTIPAPCYRRWQDLG